VHRRISAGILALVPEFETRNKIAGRNRKSEVAALQALLLRVDDRIRTGDRLDHKWEAEIASPTYRVHGLQGFSISAGAPISMPRCDDMRGLAAIRALLAEKCLAPRAISNRVRRPGSTCSLAGFR